MSGELRYTKKEMVMAQRMAFWDGANAADAFHHNSVVAERIRFMAEERYPLPKVERPRVVTDANGVSWRFGNKGFEFKDRTDPWFVAANLNGILAENPTVRPTIADLLARPSEFVDDEG